MLNINFLLNLLLFALFEFNPNCLAAEIVETSKQSNSSKLGLLDAKPKSIADQSNKHVLDFEWDLQTAAGHKKGMIELVFFTFHRVNHLFLSLFHSRGAPSVSIEA